MRTPIIMAAIVVTLLIIFNPEMDDFKVFVESQSERILLQETGDSAFGRALSSIGSSLAGSYVDRVTDRNDYLLFSTYTIDLDGKGSEENEWRFIGLGGQFIEMERPAAIRDREGQDAGR